MTAPLLLTVGRAWLPRICPTCGGLVWFQRAVHVECGPSTTNVYHLGCHRRSAVDEREHAWAREKIRRVR
jgi:hypothetical protein